MIETSKEHVKKIVKSISEESISEKNISKVIKATTHEVYIVNLSNKKVVVRIAIKDKPKFYTEVWALKNQKKLHILAPKLLKWDDSKKNVPFRFTIEEFIEGTHISENNKKETVEIYQNLSTKILQHIHKQKTVGFGPLNRQGKGEYKKWSDFLEAKFQKAFPQIEKNKLLSKKELKKIYGIHQENLKKINVKKPKLILGDLHSKNFFMKNGKFISFIDLKSVMGADPLWEYSLITYYLGLEIWPSYIKKTKPSVQRFYFYLINIAINKLWFCHKVSHPTNKTKKQLKKYVKEFPK